MSSPEQPEFAAAFMDDYYAEADEHLVALRRGLLGLEPAVGAPAPPQLLDELFRRFHSLKGISAMVELREAELLAHEMESVLRAIRDGAVTLTTRNFEALVDGVNALEQVIVSRRGAGPMPVIEPQLRSLAALSLLDQSSVVSTTARTSRDQSTGPTLPAGRVWHVTFVPSAALVERGVKIDTVRARLLAIGKVLSVTPQVLTGGRISFAFQVELEDEQALADMRDDGVTYEPLPVSDVTIPDPAPAHPPVEAATGPIALRPASPTPDGPGTTNYVRVDLNRLNDLLRLVGDLVVTRARLEDTLQRVEREIPAKEWRALQEHSIRLERYLRELREGVMRVRLVPVGEIFRRMPFVVRDLARDYGKRVRLELAGQGTEIDKFLIERMMDPVLHLVRNCISHGIEIPERRIAAGKSPEGTISLKASTAGESIVIEIADDGAGIDVAAVTARARQEGLVTTDDAPDSRMLLDILCSSGFSTRHEADRASGRGVGLAVVRSAVQDLGGTLALQSQLARGTTFTMTLPLTLAITDAIITQVAAQTFAVPQAMVREVIEVDAAAIRQIEHNELLVHRGGTLPVVRLSTLFKLKSAADRPRLHAIVVGTAANAVGLIVDRITGQQEIVVKAITDPLIRVVGVSGATQLGDGRLVLILDVVALSRTLRGRTPLAEGAA